MKSFLSAVLMLLILGASSASAQTKITFVGWGNESRYHELFDAAFKAFPALGEKYRMQYVMAPQDTDAVAKLRLALVSGTDIPDIMEFNYSRTIEFLSEGGIFADVTKVIEPYKNNILPEVLKLVTYQGRYYGFPTQIKTKLWFYRKDLFDAAGIDASRVKTTDDFIAAGKRLHAKFPRTYIWNLGPQTAGYLPIEILSGNGARFNDEKGEYVVDTDPGVRKAFTDLKRIVDSGVISRINDWSPDWQKGFADGTLASQLCAKWLTDFLPGYAGKDQTGKWAVAQWPAIGGANGGSEAGGGLFVVLERSSNKAAASEIVSKLWLTREAFVQIRNTPTFGAWSPILKDLAADPQYTKSDFFGSSFASQAAEALRGFKLFPYSPKFDQELTILIGYLDQYLSGTKSLDDALSGAERDMKNQLSNALKS